MGEALEKAIELWRQQGLSEEEIVGLRKVLDGNGCCGGM
jgi:hypothetical protein